jgi:SdrD B-like domain
MTGATVATTASAANGSYLFTNQPAGKYYLEYSNVPNGYKLTTQNW